MNMPPCPLTATELADAIATTLETPLPLQGFILRNMADVVGGGLPEPEAARVVGDRLVTETGPYSPEAASLMRAVVDSVVIAYQAMRALGVTGLIEPLGADDDDEAA